MSLSKEHITSEFKYRTSRSSGSGGQHVNKVESRVEAIFNVFDSEYLSEYQKRTIQKRLHSRIDSKGNLTVSSSSSRYQAQNKKTATNRLFSLLQLALKKKKIRKKTGIPKSVKEARLKAKKKRSETKANRKFKPDL